MITRDNYRQFKWYKVTTSDMRAPFATGGYNGWLSKVFGGWHVYLGSLSLCQRGFHATTNPKLWYNYRNYRIFEVKVFGFGGYSRFSGEKGVFRGIKFVREIVKGSEEWNTLMGKTNVDIEEI